MNYFKAEQGRDRVMPGFWLTATLILLLLPAIVCAAPILQVDEAFWNVGKIVASVEQKRSFVVENIGDEALVVEEVEQCCGFYGNLEKSRLLPGERTYLKVRLKPVSMIGDLLAELVLVSNDPRQPRFPVTAVGSVLPSQHALAELVEQGEFLDLGVMLPGEGADFSVKVRNVGNDQLRITRVEKGKNVFESDNLGLLVAAGAESGISFRYVAERSGPIEEKVTLVTNDALNRTLTVHLKGYVARDWVPDRAVVIYPVGIPARYDSELRGYRYEIRVDNRSGRSIEVLSLAGSLPPGEGQGGGLLESNQKMTAAVLYPLSVLRDGPVSGRALLQIELPVEIR